jgi:hypothetical protein
VTGFELPQQIGPVLIQLWKGVLYRERDEVLWQTLIDLQAAVRDYVGVIGLELLLDEAEGYAFLRQRDMEQDEGAESLPRLVQRRQLSYPVSLLCVLLRKRLVEQDAGGGGTRVILSREQIIEMVRVFLPERGNEAKAIDQINRHINKVVEFGFLRRLKDQSDQFEVRRIVKALVTADLLTELDRILVRYSEYVEGDEE